MGAHLTAMEGLVAQAREKGDPARLRRAGWCFVTGPDGAIAMLRELRGVIHEPRVTYDEDPDSLISFRGLPVRIRVDSVGCTSLLPRQEVSSRSCCDATAMQLAVIACSGGRA